jgi:hypothetical protein
MPTILSSEEMTCDRFLQELYAHQSDEELEKIQRYFKTGKGQYGEGDQFIGVRMGQVFAIAREFIHMPANEMSIMDKCARRKRTSDDRRTELYELYMRRHDRVNNWDLVDLAAPYVVGGYLFDRPRDILYELAKSSNVWERRTAIVATSYFIRQGDLADTFQIAEILIHDDQDLVHKAVGGWIRECGKKDQKRHLAFLDKNAARMPRTMLRYAIEHLEKDLKEHYRTLR